ncbi:MAG: radical SAM protein [Chloroflexota bacterium]|nr:MAG: radical SAM protein [Chloroflexota bacterium]
MKKGGPQVFIPAYRKMLQKGELENKSVVLSERLSRCDICPRNCGVNRIAGEVGICGVGKRVWVSSYGPHHGEEDPLRGVYGSGTIFFSGCNLNCLYCQNADISQKLSGEEVSTRVLASMMLELQRMGCHNINLVSPTHVVPQIVEAILLAAADGLTLPVVYNSGGYDAISTLQLLEGIIDIYMPDMKYSDENTGRDLSGIPSYPMVNQAAVLEMHRQVGDLKISAAGVAERGLLVRHLVLPNGLAGSQEVLRFIAEQVSADTYLNIMDQYRPAYQAYCKNDLNRMITRAEYLDLIHQAESLGMTRLDKQS